MVRLCHKINSPDQQTDLCSKKHRTKFAECASGVVYEIPLSCGAVYIGQTGRCVNDRAREHAAATRASPSGHLAIHCNRCPCTPVLHDIKILARYRDRTSREVHEAYAIRDKGAECISEASLALSKSEFEYLSEALRGTR